MAGKARPWIAAAAVLIGAAADVPAQITPLGAEFQVNTFTIGRQRQPAVALSPSLLSFFVWIDEDFDAGRREIRGRHFDLLQEPVDDDFQVNVSTSGLQSLPDVASAGTVGFVATWSGNDSLLSSGIIARHYDGDGVPVNGEFVVNEYTTSAQNYPSVAAHPDGSFVVAWESLQQDGDSSGIFARRFDSFGSSLGSDFPVNAYTVGEQRRPQAAALPNGGYVIVWRSDGQDGDGWGIFGQRYDSLGGRDGPNFQVNTFTPDDQDLPAVAVGETGVMVVAWADQMDFDSQVEARFYDSDGNPLGEEEPIAVLPGFQTEPEVGAVDRGFLFAWQSSVDIRARLFEGANTPAGEAFLVNTHTVGNQINPAVAFESGTGSLVIGWTSVVDDELDIFAQRYVIRPSPTPSITSTPAPTATPSPSASVTATLAPATMTPPVGATATPTESPAGETPTPTSTVGPSTCRGDCDGDGAVTVDELILAVAIAFGTRPVEDCPSADANSSGTIDVSELVLAVQQALEGCPLEGALFVVRACASLDDPDGQTFHALIRDPAAIAEAEDLIGAGQQRILSGQLLAGDGGFNAPWSWRLDPDTVGFADFTIELCDGCPSFVEKDLECWLDTVGQYCPWSTEVLSREPNMY